MRGLAFARSELRPAPHSHTVESQLTHVADGGQDTNNPAVTGFRISATGQYQTLTAKVTGARQGLQCTALLAVYTLSDLM